MLKAILAAMLVVQAPALATIMYVPPSGATTTVFPLPGTNLYARDALLLGQFTLTPSVEFAYSNTSPWFIGGSSTYWSPSGAPFAYITPKSDSPQAVTINLGGSYKYAGGYFGSEYYAYTYIDALGADGHVIETIDVRSDRAIANSSDNNYNEYRGFQSTSADIHYLQIRGRILMHSITLAEGALDTITSDTPEPATMGLVLIATSVFFARRRKAVR